MPSGRHRSQLRGESHGKKISGKGKSQKSPSPERAGSTPPRMRALPGDAGPSARSWLEEKGGKKEREKFKVAPERQAARWCFLSPLVARRSWGTTAPRQAACAPPPSSAARGATQSPTPRARQNISRNLRCLSHRLHLSASAARGERQEKKIKYK